MKTLLKLIAAACLCIVPAFSQNQLVGNLTVTVFEVDSTSTSSPRGIMSAQFNSGTDGARFHGRKARGTRAVPLTVAASDNLTRWVGSGYDGSNYLEMASIIFGVPSGATVAATRVPTEITMQVGTNATPSVLTTTGVFSSTTGISLTALGTNQPITLTPSGTNGVGIGMTAVASGGLLQLPAHTTAAGGIAIGDFKFFETNSTQAKLLSSGTQNVTRIDTTGAAVASGFTFQSNGIDKWDIGYAVGTGTGTAFELYNRGTAANALSVASASSAITLANLAGTGSRAVLADANGLLSAPVSDETWKENIRALPEKMGLATVLALRPLIFNYKDRSRFGEQEYVGFGARATSAILPQVTGRDVNGTFYLTDEKLTAPLVLAVQQQQRMIAALDSGHADWWARGISLLALALAVKANLRKK